MGSSPRLERVLERSMIMCLLGLLRTERLAREMSAVTRVMEILKHQAGRKSGVRWARTHCTQTGLRPATRVAPADILLIPKWKVGASSQGLTCHQTDASGSQTVLSASCLSPVIVGGRGEGEVRL